MKILIVGKDSFIGKNYIKYSEFKEITEFSLRKNNLEDIDYSKYDVILHLAALVHLRKRKPYNEYYEINTLLPVKLALLAKKSGVKQFVFISTVSVYGENSPDKKSVNEFSQCSPGNEYGKSKLEAEHELQKLSDPDFVVSIVRAPMVYGENVKANMFRLIKLVDKIPVLPFSSINNSRSFIAAENLTEYIDKIIEKKAKGIYLASDAQTISTDELVLLIGKYLNKKLILFKTPNFVVKIFMRILPSIITKIYGSFVIDNDYSIKKLDINFKVSIEEGVKKMIEMYIYNKIKKN